MDYSGAQGTLIHEKKLRSKISCQTPFNPAFTLFLFEDSLYINWGVAQLSKGKINTWASLKEREDKYIKQHRS